MDKLTKWGYFTLCIKGMLTKDLLKVYMKEMFIKYKVLVKIILDKDLRFMLTF